MELNFDDTLAYDTQTPVVEQYQGNALIVAAGLARRLHTADLDVRTLQDIHEKINGVVLADEESAAQLTSLVKILKDHAKLLDAERDTLVRPLNDHVKTINGRWKQRIDIIGAIEAAGKRALGAWQAMQRRKAEAEEAQRRKAEQERLLAVAAEQKNEDVGDAIMELADVQTAPATAPGPGVVRGVAGGSAGSMTRKIFEVTDFYAIPREYLMINEVMINQAINRKDNRVTDIPGIKIMDKEIVSIR